MKTICWLFVKWVLVRIWYPPLSNKPKCQWQLILHQYLAQMSFMMSWWWWSLGQSLNIIRKIFFFLSLFCQMINTIILFFAHYHHWHCHHNHQWFNFRQSQHVLLNENKTGRRIELHQAPRKWRKHLSSFVALSKEIE